MHVFSSSFKVASTSSVAWGVYRARVVKGVDMASNQPQSSILLFKYFV